MPAANSADRSMAASIAADSRWAREPDRRAATSAARAAFDMRFEDEVDPARRLSPAARTQRALAARKAYFTRLALRSAQARRHAGNSA